LAFSLAYLVAALLTLAVIDRQLGGIEGGAFGVTVVKTLIAGAAVAGVSWLIANAIGWASAGEALASVVLGGLAGAVVYFGLAALLRIRDIDALLALVPGRHGNG
jgi:peptidoglycan biosynthesis protein MviN/MurJ (putative lipid II flippase)